MKPEDNIDVLTSDVDTTDESITPSDIASQATISHMEYKELLTKLNETEEKLNSSHAAIEDYKNQLLRNQAELDNIRKRTEKDIQNFYKYGLEKFVMELLPVIDSLERGMSIEVGENEFARQVHAGLEMTLKLLLDVLNKSGVSPVNPLGEAFDPAFHQAVSTQENASAEPNSVLQVLQKGYLLNDRLMRPALVVVAK
jgi:molecular chaperone GrpE